MWSTIPKARRTRRAGPDHPPQATGRTLQGWTSRLRLQLAGPARAPEESWSFRLLPPAGEKRTHPVLGVVAVLSHRRHQRLHEISRAWRGLSDAGQGVDYGEVRDRRVAGD